MRPVVTDEVSWFFCQSAGHSVIFVRPAKTAEPMELSFGLWTQVGPRKRVLAWVQISHTKGQ